VNEDKTGSGVTSIGDLDLDDLDLDGRPRRQKKLTRHVRISRHRPAVVKR
jgi:hypothetical protein